MIALLVVLACGPTKVPLAASLPGVNETTLAVDVRQRLRTQLDTALANDWSPRTRHLAEDGRPLYTNRLLETDSPYLRQHAHNPVNWFPWGEEAFALAAATGRPVFLSIGYATCHWCHVMEEESFEDPEIAAFLNANYIAIKVDRETRPDVDALYMAAVQAMLGSGGWPATLLLTPERKPFFGATYLPARDGDRGRSKGLLTVLTEIDHTWRTDPASLNDLAARLTTHLQRDRVGPANSALPGPQLLAATVAATAERFDADNGGVASKRRFPSQTPLRALLIAAGRGDDQARDLAVRTLDAMATGGIYDHVGGGFHRYTVDPAWRVPHFEKMLYDNAQLARIYGEAFQVTGDLAYGRIVEETLEAMIRDLGVNGGGFASALDADSANPDGEREEGWSYTWTPAEIDDVLADRGPAFREAYGVVGRAELDGRHVLYQPKQLTPTARRALGKDRLALLLERRRRPQPLRDDKVLTSWNGLAISALAYNGWLFQQRAWVDEARATASRLLDNRIDGRLVRVDGVGAPSGTAFLDDYAFLIDGLITLFEATGERRWLTEARALETLARRHHGALEGPWYLTPDDHETLLTRERPMADNAVPSPNTVMVQNLLRLASLTTDDQYRVRADALAAGLPITSSPLAFAEGVVAMEARHWPLREIVLVTNEGERSSGMLAALRKISPNRRVLVQQVEGADAVIPLSADKVRLDAPTVYVCQGGVCEQPLTDPAAVAALLDETPPG